MTGELADRLEEGPPRRRADESGQSLVEYAFILILVAMVCIVLVAVLGHQTSNLFSNVSSGLGT
ncbi:MAG: Flp family type IVb pilin [Candidatus Dormibacteria bacterium]